MQPNARKKKWVEALLTKRAAIERAIGMPLGKMLGCGHFGCVFESTEPWVVKLSIDPTEGPIWSKIAGLVRDESWGTDGFTEIKSIHRLTPDIRYGGKKKKVWAIVREAIEPVFKEYTTRALGHHGGGTMLATTDYTNRVLEFEKPVTISVLNAMVKEPHQEDFKRAIEGLTRYRSLATDWHRPTLGTSRLASEEKIERVVQHSFYGPHAAPLGESLHMLATNGIYLRDVHLMNIGWHIPRNDDDWARIVIFDPGHTPTEKADIEEALIANAREAL